MQPKFRSSKAWKLCKRPGMYVGGTDIKALHHLVYEVVDNCVDEALAGDCDRIEITIHADESVTVRTMGAAFRWILHPTYRNKAATKSAPSKW